MLDTIMLLAIILLVIDAGWGIWIKYKLMSRHKRLFICDEDGGNCEPA